MRRILTAATITILALALAVPAASAAPKTKLMSQSTGGVQTSEPSYQADISANGNTVVFTADGDYLKGGDGNHSSDIYRRNVSGKKTKLVSRPSGGGISDGWSNAPMISANGRYVVFSSTAKNLTATKISADPQVYRRDLLTGKTKLVSQGASGAADAKCGQGASISADGRYVAFSSRAGNLTKKDTYGAEQVYLRDMKAKRTYLVSQAGGAAGEKFSYGPVVSADGRFVAFKSAADLSAKDERGKIQVFLRDRKLNKTYLISKNPSKGRAGDGHSGQLAMSNDARIIVFGSDARNLIQWGRDSNGVADIYRYDRTARKMSRVSVSWKGRQLDSASNNPDISADGRVIVFQSSATKAIKSGTSGGDVHIYRRGPKAGSIRLVDRSNQGHIADGNSQGAKVSADGKYVAYESFGKNLTIGDDDNGNNMDIFRSGPF